MTNLEKIQSTLVTHGAICDDCLSSATLVRPRQQVNILCRRLEQQSVLKRGIGFCPRCGATKMVNRMTEMKSPVGLSNPVEKNPAQKPEIKPQFREGKLAVDVIPTVVGRLVDKVSSGDIEVYNEFSLQHELGILIRNEQPDKLVQFERNVSYFGLGKSDFQKREIDIVIFDRKRTQLDAAIELKFPRNGQHPEQMFSFCKDIAFLEQLKSAGFNKSYFLVLAEDRLFYEGPQTGIYSFFRGGRKLSGVIQKPTGRRDAKVTIRGSYDIVWRQVCGSMKYALIEAQ